MIFITASYAFIDFNEARLVRLQQELKSFGDERGMKGIVLLAAEGINSTVSGTDEAINDWKEKMRSLQSDIIFKDSRADTDVFKKWLVKIKPELITFKQVGIAPMGKRNHLSPRAWKEMMERDDVVIVDARNGYEAAIGKFRNAVTPPTKNFQEFPDAIAKAAIPKEKTVMMYCTGGIRCEKALLTMERQGYKNVYQLEGGILAYLEEFPNDAFEGECFVFDTRIAVDQQLKPSTQYQSCTMCGFPVRSEACQNCLVVE